MAVISQEELDNAIAAAGGAEAKYGISGVKTIKNPKYNEILATRPGYAEPETITVNIEQWVGPNGHVIQAMRTDGGWELLRNEPPAPRAPTATTAVNTADAKAEADEKAWNAANGPGGKGLPGGDPADIGRGSGFRETHLERRAREAREAPKPGQQATRNEVTEDLKGAPGWKVGKRTVTDANGNVKTTPFYINPQGQEVGTPPEGAEITATVTKPIAGSPGWEIGTRVVKDAKGNEVSETYYINPEGQRTKTGPPDAEGKKYTNVTQDKETGKWHGLKADGTGWEEIPGGPGSKPAATGPGTSGPSLPLMVLGQSQAALRQYHSQLAAEVASGRRTQAWADNRWNEAKEVATFGIQEAQLMQQERQSSLAANINLATTKLGHETGGIKTALEFALAINGKLPPGSPLGGQAFAALLNLNMIAAQRSGIYDIKPPNMDNRPLDARQIEGGSSVGTDRMNAELTRLTNPGDPKAVEADLAASRAQLEQAVAPTPEAPAAARPEPIFRPQPVAPAPAPTGAAVPPAPAPVAPAPAAPVAPAPAPPVAPQPTVAAPPGAGASPLPLPPAGTLPGALPPQLPFNPPPGQPGHTPGGPSGLMQPPQEEFAALNQFQQSVPPTAPQMMAPGGELPPAVMRAKIASTPPWRLSEDEYRWAVENGLEDEAMSVPGMAVA